MNKILILMLSISLFGCATGRSLSQKAMFIKQGCDKQIILDKMGVPQDRQFNGDHEAWQYCRTGFDTDDFLIVWFYNDVATGVTSYKNHSGCGYTGSCVKGFRSIKWEDAPDTTIEIRDR